MRSGRRQDGQREHARRRDRVSLERYLRLNGAPPEDLWDKIAGLYPTGDGRHVRLHTNFPHHRDGVLKLLGCDYSREAVQKALDGWEGEKFETAAANAGLVATMTRSFAEWDASPQGKAIAALPPFTIEKIGDAPPQPLPAGDRPLFLSDAQRTELCEAALTIGGGDLSERRHGRSSCRMRTPASFYFIEVNPRIQVEHTVTECATGIDLVKAQIRIAAAARIGTPESGVPAQEDIRISAHALQCRVTTEDPENNFIPDYGAITAYRSPAGFGVRLDAGTAYSGRHHHPLVRFPAGESHRLVADARGNHRTHAPRAVGVPHSRRGDQPALPGPGHHPSEASPRGEYTTRFIDETPELFQLAAQARPRDAHPGPTSARPSSTAIRK